MKFIHKKNKKAIDANEIRILLENNNKSNQNYINQRKLYFPKKLLLKLKLSYLMVNKYNKD